MNSKAEVSVKVIKWLLSVKGIGRAKALKIINEVDDIKFLWSASYSELVKKTSLNANIIKSMIECKNTNEIEKWLKKHNEYGIEILSFSDLRYPENLRNIEDFPLYIFCSGDISLLKRKKTFGVVGSRVPSNYGRKVVHDVISGLVEYDFVVTSGLAMGIDALAHMGTLGKKGMTIGVIGSGIDVIYPKSNEKLFRKMREEGLIVSEYELGTPARPHQFPERNRIISGLSLGIIVIEAAIKSGSLITAKLAIDQGRDVFSVPGPINVSTSMGCNRLLQLGAMVYTNIDDIVVEYPCYIEEKKKIVKLQEKNDAILGLLKKHGMLKKDDIFKQIDVSKAEFKEILKKLEMEKVICITGEYVHFCGI